MSESCFEPKNAKEAEDFAVGELIADLQHSILKILDEKGMNQAELASSLGVSRAAVSQLLGSASNLSVQRLARVYRALGYSLRIDNDPQQMTVCWHAVPVTRTVRTEGRPLRSAQWRFDDKTASNENESGKMGNYRSIARALINVA